MSPADFTQLKKKIEQSPILSSKEKQDWLFFLPHMTAEHIKELDRILSIKMPSPAKISEQNLGGQASQFAPSDIRPVMPTPRVIPVSSPVIPSPSTELGVNSVRNLKDFSSRQGGIQNDNLQEIKSLTVAELRKALSVYVFLESLGQKMAELKRTKQVTSQQITETFEQSPLYQAYVEAGLKIMDQGQAQLLSRSEFEALADFRASLRKILSS